MKPTRTKITTTKKRPATKKASVSPVKRCVWQGKEISGELQVKYHDEQWGRTDKFDQFTDKDYFEMYTLEVFQAGLSWRTIINKRAAFKKSFANYSFARVAKFTEEDVERLAENKDIIRNRLKIRAVVHNASVFQRLIREHGSLFEYFIQFFPDRRPLIHFEGDKPDDIKDCQPMMNMLVDLKKKQKVKFVGPEICYSFCHSVGLINDHTPECFLHPSKLHPELATVRRTTARKKATKRTKARSASEAALDEQGEHDGPQENTGEDSEKVRTRRKSSRGQTPTPKKRARKA